MIVVPVKDAAGKLKFTTIPVSAGDPTVTYGASDGIVRLSETLLARNHPHHRKGDYSCR